MSARGGVMNGTGYGMQTARAKTTSKTTDRAGRSMVNLLRAGLLGFILAAGLIGANSKAFAAPENNAQSDNRQDDRRGEVKQDNKADDLPAITLTAPSVGSVTLYPAAFSLEAAVTFPGRDDSRNDKREGIDVEFLVNGVKFAEAERAPYRVSYTPTQAGHYTFTARIRYGEGKRTILSAPVDVISDQPPTVSLTAPAANTVQTAPATFTLSASAGSSTGSISKVDFYNGTTLIGTATGAPYSTTLANVPSGNYTLTAIATDNYGFSTTSGAVNVNVIAPPTVSLTSPAANAVSIAPGSFTITANASSAGSISKVAFYSGTTLLGTATSAPYSFTWNNVMSGTYSLTAVATDGNGASTTSAPVSVISDAPPAVSLTSPAANTVSTAPSSFNLSANATSTTSTISKVDFYNGTTLIGTATSAPYGFAWNNVPSGTYSLTAVATDNLGATTTSALVSVTSNALPTVNITAPVAASSYTTPSNITITANAADSDGTISKVEFYNGTALLGSATAAPYSFTWNSAPAGTYSLTAVATDNLGGSTTSAAVSVNVIAPPVVSLSAPANNTVAIAPANLTLTANASSAGTIAKVDFYNGTTLLGTATSAPYNFAWNNVSSGTYSLTAVATDGNGASTTSAPVSVISNAPPAVTLTSPAANAVSTAPGSFTLTANATDSDGTIAKVDFYQGTTLIGTATTAPYSFIWSNAPAGTYSLTAVATDNLGASTTSAPVSVISDALPTVSLTSPLANAVSVAPGSFILTASATSTTSTIAKVDFYANNILVGTATAAPYSFTWSNVPAGTYALTAVSTDALGITATSAAITVTSDQAPSVNLTSSATGAQITSPGSLTLTATAASTTSTIAKVDFYNGTTLLGTATSAPYTYIWNSVPVGSYSLMAVATDALGTTTTSSAIAITAIANVPPAISLTGPANGTTVKVPGSFTLTANATSTTSAIARVDFYNGTTLIGTSTSAPYSFIWANVPLGTYSLTAVATDALNATTTSSPITVTVNTGIAHS